MVRLFQFRRAFGVANPSPFCMKVETWLRMAGVEHEIVVIADPRKSPKGKAPVIEHDGETIADSTFILDHLDRAFSPGLDDHLDERQRAVAHAFARMLEERTYWALLYDRWIDEDIWPIVRETFFGDLPPVLRTLLPVVVRRSIRKALWAQGVGRHSPREIRDLAIRDLDAVAAWLGESEYFMGDRVSTVDAVAYAFLANVVEVQIEAEVVSYARARENLVAYCARMRAAYFPDL